MIGALLSKNKLDPTLIVGGLVKSLDTNSKLGSGDLIVVEADESVSYTHLTLPTNREV